MAISLRFSRGTNISHWLSQTDLSNVGARGARFTKDDVARIKGFGLDHIRLPFDYALLERDESPGEYVEDGFSWIERCLDWCEEIGLNVILDMHGAPGASFMESDNPLYHDGRFADRFCKLWAAIARRFVGRGHFVAFELLNEPTATDPADWNRVAESALAAIRSVDESSTVIVGSNRWNACETFPELAVFDDPNVVYTFHFYHPFVFTHQRASWARPLYGLYQENVPYPGRPPALEKVLKNAGSEHRDWAEGFCNAFDRWLDARYLEEKLQPVLEFRRQHEVPVYCGEFGVYAEADDASRREWYRDMLALFTKYSIGWANWDYQGGFGLLDSEGRPTVVHEVLVQGL